MEDARTEADYRECDPLNLDASAMYDDQALVDLPPAYCPRDAWRAISPRHAALGKQIDFYVARVTRDREAGGLRSTYTGFLSWTMRLCELADKMGHDGLIDAAEYVMVEAVIEYATIDDQIADASDGLDV